MGMEMNRCVTRQENVRILQYGGVNRFSIGVEKFSIFLLALRKFTEADYEYIGMDHFARPSDELATARANRTLWRNFQGYTTKAGTDLFGLGMSAISHVHGSYFQNQREISSYQ